MIGALRDGGLSRHADDCEMDISERDVELLQSVAMKADVYFLFFVFLWAKFDTLKSKHPGKEAPPFGSWEITDDPSIILDLLGYQVAYESQC